MIIKSKRIRSLDRYFTTIRPGTKLVLAVRILTAHQPRLTQVGFTPQLQSGESVLPPASLGPVCKDNAEGWIIIHRDRPKETAFRMMEWHWKQWRGRYDSEEQSKLVNVPYKRFPRTVVPPPSVELSIGITTSGEKLVTVGPVTFEKAQEAHILHCVNLVLEILGECEVLSEKLDSIIRAPIRRLNWDVLPPGQHPWASLKNMLTPIIARAPAGNQKLIVDRLETVSSYLPEFVAVGRAGFTGYVAFGFPKKQMFVLESANTGNATYVFGNDWQRLSQLSKGEILAGGLQKERVVHLVGWHTKIKRLLG